MLVTKEGGAITHQEASASSREKALISQEHLRHLTGPTKDRHACTHPFSAIRKGLDGARCVFPGAEQGVPRIVSSRASRELRSQNKRTTRGKYSTRDATAGSQRRKLPRRGPGGRQRCLNYMSCRWASGGTRRSRGERKSACWVGACRAFSRREKPEKKTGVLMGQTLEGRGGGPDLAEYIKSGFRNPASGVDRGGA